MRPECREFVKIMVKHIEVQGPVLEVGSLQVAGQCGFADLRPFFPGLEYTGLDMREGAGVDLVCNAESLPSMDNHYGVVVSVDTLEHVARPWLMMNECARVMRDDGLAIFTTVFDFPKHEQPHDYWRMTVDGLLELMQSFKGCDFVAFECGQVTRPHTVACAAFQSGNLVAPHGLSLLTADLYEWQLRWRKASHEE